MCALARTHVHTPFAVDVQCVCFSILHKQHKVFVRNKHSGAAGCRRMHRTHVREHTCSVPLLPVGAATASVCVKAIRSELRRMCALDAAALVFTVQRSETRKNRAVVCARRPTRRRSASVCATIDRYAPPDVQQTDVTHRCGFVVIFLKQTHTLHTYSHTPRHMLITSHGASTVFNRVGVGGQGCSILTNVCTNTVNNL